MYADVIEELARLKTGRVDMARAGLATQARLCVDMLRQGRCVAWVVRNRDELLTARALMTLFSPEFSCDDAQSKAAPWTFLPPFSPRSASREGWTERLAALYALQNGQARGVLLTADNLLPKLVPLDFFEGRELRLVQGEEVSLELILEQVTQWGYERVSMVSNAGEVARRGDILDIMPPGYDKPVRLDFFGDLIEEIRLFDPVSQRSKANLSEVLVLPVSPTRQDAAGRDKMQARWKRLFQKGLLTENERFGLTRLQEQGDFRLMPGCCYDAATTLESWLPADAVWVLPGRNDFRESLETGGHLWTAAFEAQDAEGRPQPLRFAVREAGDAEGVCARSVCAYAEQLVADGGDCADLPERALSSFGDLFPSAAEQDRPWQTLVQALKRWQHEKRQVVLCFASEKSRTKFLTLAAQDGLSPQFRYDREQEGLFALIAPFRAGADLIWDRSLILGEDVLQPHVEKSRRVPSGAFKGLERYDELKPGDLLVHRDYGIARFGGLLRMETGSTANDFLLLHYSGDDRLYVPVDRLSLIQRFKGGGEATPPLDRLGGGSWQSGKEKARKAIEKIAEDLVEMYAWRKVAKGFRYPPLGELYREFEASFGFEETPDQARAIQDVLADMEKPEPMDRLVCGDVGFGKTEVAMRAIFKAVTAGKQVAVLVPTTVLSQQHFQTFMERFGPFGVHVDVLNRFRSYKEKKDILARTLTGDIDVLIGTHSLLNKKVKFKDLGLLVVDEEQRFGVAQKEKWKAWAANIDVLSLSATPIPRTLHMSLVNLREMCVIETPPTDRFPVQTYVTEYDARIVSDAIMREKRRGGQVFFVYNRVATIEKMKDELQALLPDVTIGIAHGQMAGSLLESVMFDFYEGKYDVLLCSSLVENGLDVANANTIIIYDADHFGLSQLYQMRGRVGRSHRMAYAYFLYRRDKVLSEVAEKRLQAIKEFTELGSGFKIAMRDLEIRGAGNLLGREQHGNIASVGFAMYCHMLEDAIAKAQNGKEAAPPPPETVMEIHVDAFIDDDYIQNGGQKIEMYQRLAVLSSKEELADLRRELADRYGKPSQPVEKLLQVTETRLDAKAQGLVLIAQKKDVLELKWQRVADMPDLSKLEPSLRRRFRLVPNMPVMVRVSLAGISDVLAFIQTLLVTFSSLRKGNSLE